MRFYIFDKRTLYNNSDVKTTDASYYIFAFMHRFKLSIVCREELLELCQYLLPLDNNLPRNYSKLKEKIGLGNVSIKTKKYCEICKILLEESEY